MSTWVQLCLVVLISIATKSHVLSPFTPLLFAEAAVPTNDMNAEKLEKMRLASKFLEQQELNKAREAMKTAAIKANEKKEKDARKKRQAERQKKKAEQAKIDERRRRRAEEY